MKRWNGWGDDSRNYPLPEAARSHLAALLGPGRPPRDASRRAFLDRLPSSTLSAHPLIDFGPEARLDHAFGQSAADWITLRGGLAAGFPAGVARPETDAQTAEILAWAAEHDCRVIPYGGGTSVAGHLSVDPDGPPIISLSLARMNRLLELDETNRLARFQAGVRGPDLESALRAQGRTLGHFPQSFEYSTLGGWVACRSVGQFSLGYGRMDSLFTGGRLQTPSRPWDLPCFPASSAGPDLRQAVLGSEGRLGVITEAVVRTSPLPQAEIFKGAFFRDQDSAIEAVRTLAGAGLELAMVRLSLARETETSLLLTGPSRMKDLLARYLRARGAGPETCLLIYGASGRRAQVKRTLGEAGRIIRAGGGLGVGTKPGRQWFKNRFKAPYLRNALWQAGYAVDTMETALPWTDLGRAARKMETELSRALEPWNEKVLAFAHLSHVYPHGTSLYLTCLFRLAEDPAQTLERWRTLKDTASRNIVELGGTISHQHGVGLDHAPWLAREKGPAGLAATAGLLKSLDPRGLMNPGKLLA